MYRGDKPAGMRGGTGAPPTWGGTLSFVCPPPPLPLTWHLRQADGNSVSEEAAVEGGQTHSWVSAPPPAPMPRG